ncbi:MAG: ATP-binding protein [Dehalococcoidia bacterium]
MTEATRIAVEERGDIERVRAAAHDLTSALGFSRVWGECVVLAALELASNLWRYAHDGVIVLTPLHDERGAGIRLESCDAGPGIPDLARAMEDGYSTGGGLGHGLPSVRRLMDTFTVESSAAGSHIVADKWTR